MGRLRCLLYLLALDYVAPALQTDSSQQVFEASQESSGSVLRYSNSEELLQIIQNEDLDVWFRNSSVVDLYLPKWESKPKSLDNYSPLHSFTPVLNDHLAIQKHKAPNSDNWNLSTLTNCSFHSSYHPLYEIDHFVEQLALEFPKLVKLRRLGHTAEGREMYGLRIRKKEKTGKGKKKKVVKKKAIVIQGAQHAREWIASAAALYLAHALVIPKSATGSLNLFLDDFDFHFIPSPNPDGYEYTWSEDRFWYKNRMLLGSGRSCKGLDMNRNWGFMWSPDSISSNDDQDLCSYWYPGSRPFEAPEVFNIAHYVDSVPRKVGFLDLRSYGQTISTPFSYSCDVLPSDAEDLLEAALGAAATMMKVHGTHVTAGSLCEMLYSAPGNVVDWMYTTADIKYSYAIHLRDTGTFGYTLPPDRIRPTGEETSKMLEYLAKFIKARP